VRQEQGEESAAVAIFVLVLWIATAAAGFTLLRAGGAARRLAAQARAREQAAKAEVPVPASTVPARIGALPLTEDGKPPPVPHPRVVTAPGEHPLLEFSHPALAVTGAAFWAMFTFVHYRPMAWIAIGVLIVTISVGLSWLARGRRERRREDVGWRFPPRLVALHGLTATLTIVLTVVSALVARG
jgi:Flp pilus assembly protein TadB